MCVIKQQKKSQGTPFANCASNLTPIIQHWPYEIWEQVVKTVNSGS